MDTANQIIRAAQHMDWATIITIVAASFTIVGFFFRSLNGNIVCLDNDIKAIVAQTNAEFVALHTRIDAANQRIDLNQAIIMRMLEKQGR